MQSKLHKTILKIKNFSSGKVAFHLLEMQWLNDGNSVTSVLFIVTKRLQRWYGSRFG
jgi:hypothetical protein